VLAPDMASSALARRAPQRWSSSELLGGAAEAEILHAGTTYRLRLTALGKLILTK
jgi:hemin uptake protein HemP